MAMLYKIQVTKQGGKKMTSKQKSIMGIVMACIMMGLFLPEVISAGDLEPSAPPGPTMHTLEDIYILLVDTNSKVSTGSCDGAPVERTGQTTSYATGDDGDLEEGVSWPDPRFTDNGDGTVTDNLTGLVWLKNANCFATISWSDALSACNTLNSGEHDLTDGSAEGDWRLPNVNELHSLIDYGRYNPALPSGHPFTGVQSGVYWTSTTYASSTDYAWYVELGYGRPWYNTKTNVFYVWPVRSEQ